MVATLLQGAGEIEIRDRGVVIIAVVFIRLKREAQVLEGAGQIVCGQVLPAQLVLQEKAIGIDLAAASKASIAFSLVPPPLE
jgi:hypothetical protein